METIALIPRSDESLTTDPIGLFAAGIFRSCRSFYSRKKIQLPTNRGKKNNGVVIIMDGIEGYSVKKRSPLDLWMLGFNRLAECEYCT